MKQRRVPLANTAGLFGRLMVVFFLFFTVFLLHAQPTRGRSPATCWTTLAPPIADATVTAKGLESGSVYTTKSTSSGNFRFPSIQLGRYEESTG